MPSRAKRRIRRSRAMSCGGRRDQKMFSDGILMGALVLGVLWDRKAVFLAKRWEIWKAGSEEINPLLLEGSKGVAVASKYDDIRWFHSWKTCTFCLLFGLNDSNRSKELVPPINDASLLVSTYTIMLAIQIQTKISGSRTAPIPHRKFKLFLVNSIPPTSQV